MWQDLLAAFGLVLIIEGIAPFLNPGGYKRALQMALQMEDSGLRRMGLILMIIGLLIIYGVR